jgi:hypothetical protein
MATRGIGIPFGQRDRRFGVRADRGFGEAAFRGVQPAARAAVVRNANEVAMFILANRPGRAAQLSEELLRRLGGLRTRLPLQIVEDAPLIFGQVCGRHTPLECRMDPIEREARRRFDRLADPRPVLDLAGD